MIDINLIRTNPELVKENMRKKFRHDQIGVVDEVKAVRSATSKEEALKAMPALFSMLDKAAAKGRAGFCANRVD